MNKLVDSVGIRASTLKAPIVLVANIPTSYYNQMGTQFYDPMHDCLNKIAKKQHKVTIVPNTVGAFMSIEQRAELMAEKIAKVSEAKGERVHLVAHSFAGIDARAAISLMGLNQYVRSLTTVCTPHHGSYLVTSAMRYDKHQKKVMMVEKAFEVMGLSLESAQEYCNANMRSFNEVATDCEDVDYYSFSAKKTQSGMCDLLKPGWEMITNNEIRWECDGVNRVDDMKYAQHLLTFDHDHFDVIGFNSDMKPQHVANLIGDNCRLQEVKQENPFGLEAKHPQEHIEGRSRVRSQLDALHISH